MNVAPARPKPAGKISEAELQKAVIAAARAQGWRVAHFRPAQVRPGRYVTPVDADGAGFPDLVLCRGDRLVFAELKAQGRLRYIGVTHYRDSAHDDLLAVLRREKVDFVQFNYSVGERNAEKRLLPFCADHGIATLINRPYMRGALFARVKGQPLPPLAQELGASSWAQLLLKYILAEPAVTAVIPATDKPHYMADNLLAGQGRLPDAQQRAGIVELFA